ncbi:hypothetical protein RhiJN_12345 [Ceratobasidium sp. AG-Ba]|nr:hypothetical protein RhiJN_12345 [Ceratobasidium sp. AG-Ba]
MASASGAMSGAIFLPTICAFDPAMPSWAHPPRRRPPPPLRRPPRMPAVQVRPPANDRPRHITRRICLPCPAAAGHLKSGMEKFDVGFVDNLRRISPYGPALVQGVVTNARQSTCGSGFPVPTAGHRSYCRS